MLFELSFQKGFDLLAILGAKPAALNEEIREVFVFVGGPGSAGFDKLTVVDQVRLQGQNAEQKVAIGVAGSRGGDIRHGRDLLARDRFGSGWRRTRDKTESRV